MIYANFLPLVLSVGLVIYVYSIHPQGKSNHLFALFMLCTTFHAIALFTTSTVSNQTLALWLGALRYFIAYTLSDLLFWFLALELVYRTRQPPRWIRIYTLVGTILSVGAAIISQLDFAGTTALFYRQMGFVPGRGYVAPSGPLYVVPQLVRLLLLGGALYVLVFEFLQGDRPRQLSIGISLVPLILFPVVTRVVLQLTNAQFTGIGTLADYVLALGLGFAVARNLFAPVEIALRRVMDSMTEGLIVLDTAGHVLRVNQTAARLLGIDENRVQYQPYGALFDRWDVEDESIDTLQEALARTQALSQESQIGHGEQHLHVQIQTSPIVTPRGLSLGQMILLRDVTTIRNREERLVTALETQGELTRMMTELSSPVLPVLEQTIVLPLVGTLTVERAMLILRTLLEGVKDLSAQIAILDLTGVPSLPPEAAPILVQAVDATQLLGTQLLMVGIRPEVAQTLGDLKLDFGNLVVLPDLQAGVTYAIDAQLIASSVTKGIK